MEEIDKLSLQRSPDPIGCSRPSNPSDVGFRMQISRNEIMSLLQQAKPKNYMSPMSITGGSTHQES